MTAADKRGHGLGGANRAFAEQQIAEVSDPFGLKTRAGVEAIYKLPLFAASGRTNRERLNHEHRFFEPARCPARCRTR